MNEYREAAIGLVLLETERIGRAKKAITGGVLGAGVGGAIGAARQAGANREIGRSNAKIQKSINAELAKAKKDPSFKKVAKKFARSQSKRMQPLKTGGFKRGAGKGGLGAALLFALASKEVGQKRR